MRVPVSWLRELVDVDATVGELAEKLSMHGIAVDSIEHIGGGVAGVVVAKVLEVSDVPDSDKLVVAQVDAGEGGRVQVVAGAKNFSEGDRVPLALPGARVTTLDSPVGVRTMAGRYESRGMLCSARELGVSDAHEGILVLGQDAPLGADVVELLALDDDVLELEIYPNRPDCMSMIGVAREVAVMFGTTLREPSFDVVEDGPEAASLTSVSIEDTDGCPRYLARVIEDVAFGPSPAIVQARLTACGFRPLGNLVDATNYILLLTGQPLHAFDLDRLSEERIVVRSARAGEVLKTLDDAEHALDPEDLVIADARDAQALAGVMGGATSEVGASTRRVLLESAYFRPVRIARTARRHRMRTEASARFERGADPEAVPRAAAACAELMRTWAGGRVARGAVDAGAVPPRRSVQLRRDRVTAILGVPIPDEEARGYLAGLGCAVDASPGGFTVEVPSWRPDLEREIDLIEEIARLRGYESFPLTERHGRRGFLTRDQLLRRRVREVMLGAGLTETQLSPFVSDAELDIAGEVGALRITNPLSVEQGNLRPSLTPGLLRAVKRNTSLGTNDVRLFEIGSVFGPWTGGPIPQQEHRLGAVLSGHRERTWHAAARPVDAFDAKGIVELLMDELGIGEWDLEATDEAPLHPGRAAGVMVGGLAVGRFGEARPSVAAAVDADGGLVLLELSLPALFAAARDRLQVREPSRFPGITRDVAVVVDEAVPAGEVEAAVRGAGGPLLESVVVFDVYRGDQVQSGRKSVALRLTLRSEERTLTTSEADAVRDAVVGALRDRFGGDVR